MNIVTIPRKYKDKELVAISRREYEEFLEMKKIKEFVPTPAQRRSLRRAENNLKLGKTLSLNELASRLGFTD